MQRVNVWARALPHHRLATGSTLDTLSIIPPSPSLPASLMSFPTLPFISLYSSIHSHPHSYFILVEPDSSNLKNYI